MVCALSASLSVHNLSLFVSLSVKIKTLSVMQSVLLSSVWCTCMFARLYIINNLYTCTTSTRPSLRLYTTLSVCMSNCAQHCLSVCLHTTLSVCLAVHNTVCNSVCTQHCLSLCLYITLSVCTQHCLCLYTTLSVSLYLYRTFVCFFLSVFTIVYLSVYNIVRLSL